MLARVIRLADLTWPEARRRARSPRSVVLLPLGAVEQHGPHLPLSVDWLGAEALARRVAPPLARAGWLPPVWVDWAAALRRGATSFERMAPGGRGYFGWPAAARAVTGRRVLALRGRLIAAALLEDLRAWPRRVTAR